MQSSAKKLMTASTSWRLNASKRAPRSCAVNSALVGIFGTSWLVCRSRAGMAGAWPGKTGPAPHCSFHSLVSGLRAGRSRFSSYPSLPWDEQLLEVAHEQVEGEGEDTDHDDAHDDRIAGEILGRVEHHEAETAVGGHHFGGDQRGPAHPDADAHAGEDFR